MIQDEHNGTDGYIIRLLYFDTLYDDDFFEKLEGVETRRKIRLRIYDPKHDFAMLEMKQKQGASQKKRSLRMSRADAEDLIRGKYEVLLKYEEDYARECYGLMHYKCYRPKTIVQYNRKAYIAKENKIRITFDNNIIATETNFDLFSENLVMYPVLDKFNVVYGRRKIQLGRKAEAATGSFKYDVSDWVIGYIVGVDWEPTTVAYTNEKYKDEALRSTYSRRIDGVDTYRQENIPDKNSFEFVPINTIVEKKVLSENPLERNIDIPVETGKLLYGNANPESEEFNSLADFCSDGDYIEIKLPWQLLNFSDPLQKENAGQAYEQIFRKLFCADNNRNPCLQ